MPAAKPLKVFASAASMFSFACTAVMAETRAPIDNVTIIGHKRDVSDIPGSAHVVDNEELKLFLQSDVMRVLRSVPGVYVQEEEGYGLRPNIGIRGSGLDRSARIAVLEDGVLISPAPYSAPAAYYFPTQRRMYALEVLKGPAAIAVGPRTTGGAINLVSTPIPETSGGHIDFRLGQHETLDAFVNYGMRGERFSWLIETVQAESDGFKTIDGPSGVDTGPTGFDVQDYLLKLQFDSAPGAAMYQSLRLKAGYTDQQSDETYLGLTDADFAANPNRRYAASAGDVFDGEHEMLQLSYIIESTSNWDAEVTVYRNDFARDWYKVDSVAGVDISNVLADPVTYATELGYLKGDTSPDDAIVKRHNNREYYSEGIQGDVSWDLQFGATQFSLTTGFRVHEDEEDRLQRDNRFRMEDLLLVQTFTGAPGSQSNRVSSADSRALFIDTEIRTGRWIFTPGARFEDIDLTRENYSTADPNRLLGPTSVVESSVSAVIPGIGALYRLNEQWRLLAGVHEGFNPPAPGTGASEESSVNLELGTRFSNDTLEFEGIYFLNDYDNLVGTVTASTGGGGQIGDQYDGGEVTVQGFELSVSSGWSNLGAAGLSIPVSLSYTWTTEAEFHNAFESEFEPWGDVQIGDELPYIPEHQLRAMAGLEGKMWTVNLAANYVGEMRATAGQGTIPTNDLIESHTVWDLMGNWRINDAFSSYVKVDNLFDEVYVAARRPAGLRPGLERTAYVGVTFGF